MLIQYLISIEKLPQYLELANTLVGSVLTIVCLVLWLATTVTVTTSYLDDNERRQWNLFALFFLAYALISFIFGLFAGTVILVGLFGLFCYVVSIQVKSVFYHRPENDEDDESN